MQCLEVYVIIVESKDTCLKIVDRKKKTRITDQIIGNNQENEMRQQWMNQIWIIYFDEMAFKMEPPLSVISFESRHVLLTTTRTSAMKRQHTEIKMVLPRGHQSRYRISNTSIIAGRTFKETACLWIRLARLRFLAYSPIEYGL